MFIWLSIRPALIGVEGGHDVSWEPTGPNSITEVDQHGNHLFPGPGTVALMLTTTVPSGEGFVRFYSDGGPDAAAGWDYVAETD